MTATHEIDAATINNPATGGPVGTVRWTDPADVPRIAAGLRKAQREWEARGAAGRAKVLARRGAHDAAAHLIAEALAVAHRIEQTNYQAIADMDAAEVYSLAGRAEEARAALERALDLAHRKGNLPMAAHIEELLAA